MSGEASPEVARAGQSAGKQFAAAAGIMVAGILASRVLGLVREIVASRYFGAERYIVADCYRAAFSLPDLLYFLIAGGALSSAFIPVFTEYLTGGEEEEAWRVYSVFGTVLGLGLALLIALGMIFTEPLVRYVVAPDFPPEKIALTVSLTRIALPAQLAFFVGGLMISTLYARQYFLTPALGPVIYNLAIIVGAIVGGAWLGPERGVFGMVWGVLIGAFVGNVLLQLFPLRRLGVRYRPSLDLRHPGVRRVGRLVLPVILGLSLPQLHLIIARRFASGLAQGSITWLTNANYLMQLPLGIFAQALGIAIFPTLSQLAARRDVAGLREQFSLGLRSILFLTVPSSVLIVLLATPLVRLLFQYGAWTPNDTTATAAATVWYSVAIFAISGQAIVNRGFYALQDTLTPMLVGTVVTLLYLAVSVAIVPVLAHVGLAMTFSAVNILALAMLLVLFRQRIGSLREGEIVASVGRILVATVALGIATWLAREAWELGLGIASPATLTPGRAALLLAGAALPGIGAYVGVSAWLQSPELATVVATLRRRLRRGS